MNGFDWGQWRGTKQNRVFGKIVLHAFYTGIRNLLAGDETLKARMPDKQAVQPKKRILPNTGFMQTRKLLS